MSPRSTHLSSAAPARPAGRAASSAARRWSLLRRLHRGERGAISVLVLLTVWCLVALTGMAWNTAEESKRRQHVQAAADSAAHAAATWMARSVNAITAQNMAISQDASAKTVWLAINGTDRSITQRLASESAGAATMQGRAGPALARISNAEISIAAEYTLVQDAIKTLQSGSSPVFASKQDQDRWNNDFRRAQYAVDWLITDYFGKQLSPFADTLKVTGKDPAVFKAIQDFIDGPETDILLQFENQVGPVQYRAVDVETDSHREQVYQNSKNLVGQTFPTGLLNQNRQLADYHGADLALATLNPDANGSPQAPLTPAEDVPWWPSYTDTIRARYPTDAALAGKPITFDIDPLNPHTFNPETLNDATIWHPDVNIPVPVSYQFTYNLAPVYRLNCNVSGGWGHLWAAPLERNFYSRVDRDLSGIRTDAMLRLDQARSVTLANLIRSMLQLQQLNPPAIPGTIPDPQPDPLQQQPVYVPIPILPSLTLPTKGTFPATWRQQITLYNQHRATLLQAVQSYRNAVVAFLSIYTRYTIPFAQDTWYGEVAKARDEVVRELGAGRFYVLSSYRLRPIPEWARPAMHEAVTLYVEDRITSQNMRQIMVDAHAKIPNWFVDAQIADYIIKYSQGVMHQAAVEIADEWNNRPWPYEIAPPDQPVPPFRGMGPTDRQSYFTIMAAARERSQPRLLMPWLYSSAPLAAYAQAEAFNWMEFNDDYGQAERFDTPVAVPWTGDTGFIGSPRCWRTDTIGGWNWRARLSLSDTLSRMAATNGDFAEYLSDAGIAKPDDPAVDEINEH